ncbi:Transketolase [Dimargaris cristalligena]|uniref:Transketolase n=1 Tax=Dimargaris cristalligena TaxID=215637 RepID=A0A4P9ZV37_9FUNG|nr:Transketolase [Dimargaris cristalligena]RKP37435.1 Transketolase, thiamine diphosphate binding domain-containing protein [Dimargaris cristalligena]|eukprot:RKP37435.1 Transketolase, thiamine diphosphate binding domain-containing protein [Dimargaris cristalligena]
MSNQNIDSLAVNTIRTLAADVVQKANSGHPGAPMGCAPMAHVLFSRFINANPKNSQWYNRDRFVLSNGHACALQYILHHLMGYKVSMNDLKDFRQMDSCTPGHPENTHTDGIEVTTGPLGQGIANAVGIAAAEAHMAATFNRPGFTVVDNYTYVMCGDGCLQEGVAAEAASLAGHLKLGKLVLLYDDNHVQIDGDTNLGFTEDVLKRFEAYDWHTQKVADGDHDLEGIASAIAAAKQVTDKPSIIAIRTTIGFGALKAGTAGVHGSPLGDAGVAEVKTKFGFNPNEKFVVPSPVYDAYKAVAHRGQTLESEWEEMLHRYESAHPDLTKDLKRRLAGKLPDGWKEALPRYTPADKALATRKFSEVAINALANCIPELMGGSADLTGSNLTHWKGAVEFQSESTGLGSYAGRYFRFGVREHGMAAMLNGMAAYGGVIPFGATFLNFIEYAMGAVRLSALSRFRVLYIMTHDSIGLGEDGPTHQPVEALAACRATPNMLVFRPADGNEVTGTYIAALENTHRPSVLSLTRQNLPNLEGSSVEKTLQGAYVLQDNTSSFSGKSVPDIVFVATGSEVSICVKTAELLQSQHQLATRVVSMPCMELFAEQSHEYRESVLPRGSPVISVEVLSTVGWGKIAHASIGLDHFGMSAPAEQIYHKLGFYPEAIADKAVKVIKYYSGRDVPYLLDRPFE